MFLIILNFKVIIKKLKKKNYRSCFYYRKHQNKVDKDLIKIIENLSKTKKNFNHWR